MQQFAGELKNDLNIEQMVVSKIDNISPEKLESLLHRTLAKELRFASIFGIGIGLLVGFIQMVILLLIG